jgi:hypothetical protein
LIEQRAPAKPQDRDRAQGHQHRARRRHASRWREANPVREQQRQVVVAGGSEQGQSADERKNEHDASDDHGEQRRLIRTRLVFFLPHQSVAQQRQGEKQVPEPIERRCGLKAGAKETGRRKCARKRERVRNDHRGREKVAAGEDEESAQPIDRELREQQHRGDQVGHEYDPLEGGNECVDLRKLDFSERGEKRERRDLTYGDGDRPSRLPTCRRLAQQPRLGACEVTRIHRRPLSAESRRPRTSVCSAAV